jgi:hypothetical protein
MRELEVRANRKLKLGVGVRADFAIQIDLFVLWGDPFHGSGSLEIKTDDTQRIA